MDAILSIDWSELFEFSVSPAEIIIRGTVMYWFLFAIFRFVIHRDVGAVGVADLLVLVIVADAAQNAMAGEYTSVSDGMVLVATLIGWNLLFDWLSFRFAAFRRFAEPRALPLVRDGRMLKRNMRKELISEEELWSKIRQQGLESLEDVKTIYMESDGEISVIRKQK